MGRAPDTSARIQWITSVVDSQGRSTDRTHPSFMEAKAECDEAASGGLDAKVRMRMDTVVYCRGHSPERSRG